MAKGYPKAIDSVARVGAGEHNSRVMANFAIPAPVEPQKSTFLHDRSNRPKAPATNRLDLAKRWAGFALGLVFGVGSAALLFSIRDSWENHREWLVTVIPVLVIAAIALAYLVSRQKGAALGTGLAFLIAAIAFAGSDILVDREPNPSSTAQDTLSILGGVALALASIALIVAFLIVEIRNPTKAPTPEL
jgi:hypothetical protein